MKILMRHFVLLFPAKSSRDSGLSSDDPSPNTSHSSSTGQSPTTNLMFDQILSTQQEGAGMRPLNRSQSSDAALLSSRISKRVESHSSKFICEHL